MTRLLLRLIYRNNHGEKTVPFNLELLAVYAALYFKQSAYLPTMPQDELMEVREALLGARANGRNDPNPFMWGNYLMFLYSHRVN